MTAAYCSRSAASIRLKRAQLAGWLAEWELDKAMRSDRSTCWKRAESGRAGATRSARTIAAGQVRLLHPDSCVVASARPVYVLVVAQLPSALWAIVPFSRFRIPAVPDEWRTGLRAMHVRVLCLWNAREIVAGVLDGSWVVTALGGARMELVGSLLDGFDPNIAPSRAVGPPLVHPLDPRWEYLVGEASDFDCLGSLRVRAAVYPYVAACGDLRMAAEGHEKYD